MEQAWKETGVKRKVNMADTARAYPTSLDNWEYESCNIKQRVKFTKKLL